MQEFATDPNPMRGEDFRLPADGMGTNYHARALAEKEAQAQWLKSQTKRVFELADDLLSGGTVSINGNSFSYRQVMAELKQHRLYEGALNALTLGNSAPMEDLTLRVARRSAAFMLRIDPEELGIGE